MSTVTPRARRDPQVPPDEPLAATTPPVRPRRRRPSPVCWLVLILVLVPVAASTFHRSTSGWVPDGDEAWFARRVMQVGTTAPPMIGMASTASEQPTRGTNHPGPVELYLVAGPYAISGWSPVGLAIGTGLIVAVALAAAVVMAWRIAGDRGAVAVGLGLAMMSTRVSQEWLVRPNNAVLAIFPLFAAMVGLWAYLRRDRAGLAVALLAASFCLQTSLGVLPAAGAVVAGCGATWIWHRRQGVRGAPLGRGGRVVAVAIGVMWLPPILEMVVRAPGNLTDVGHFLLSQVGLVTRETAYTSVLGLGPAMASMIQFLTGVPGLDGHDFESNIVPLITVGDLALLPTVIGVSILGVSAAWAFRRGSPALRSLWILTGPALLVTTVALSRKPTDELLTQPYFVTWTQPSVALVWTAVALSALEAAHLWSRRAGAAPRGRRLAVAPSVAVGILLVALFAVSAASGGINRTDSRRVSSLSAQVRERVPKGTYLMWEEGFVPWNSTAKGLGADLIAHGYDIRFREWGGMIDEPRREGDDTMAKLLVTSELAGDNGVDVVARTEEPDLLLLVRLIPGGADNAWCEEMGAIAARARAVTPSPEPGAPAALPQTSAGWTALLSEIEVQPLVAAAADDDELRPATELVGRLVPVTLSALADGSIVEAPDDLQENLRRILDDYDQRCDARSIPGAKLVPTG